jgi:hypothetical protein
MECEFNLLCYGLFKNSFMIYFICRITSWLEIGIEKKCYFQYNVDIHILSQISTTLEKDFEKWF